MSAAPGSHGSGVRYDDTRIGDTIETSLTVTETHLVLGAGLIGDFNPHHVDETYARGTRYGGRILHGMLTSAIMGAPLGMWFHGTAIGYLEHHVRFLAPVYPGDTLTTRWRIVAVCSGEGERGRETFDLSMAGGRLVWHWGSQPPSYVRCSSG